MTVRLGFFSDTPLLEHLNPGLPRVASECDVAFSHILVATEARLELRQTQGRVGPVFVDFLSSALTERRKSGGGFRQEMARAVGLGKGRRPHVVDATAGLGKDAFVLAALGCSVTAIERNPIVFALLSDGFTRAAASPEVAEIIGRMKWFLADAAGSLGMHNPEVVYLDPMYPEKTKRALPKKEMQTFHDLVGRDMDAQALLEAALSSTAERVVVKRPKGAPHLGNQIPQGKIESKNTRYDLYFPKS